MSDLPEFQPPDCYQRLDFRLLQNGAVHLYFKQEVLAGDIQRLATYGYEIKTVDASLAKCELDLLTAIGVVLEFPDYYGKNLDALNDCLSDLLISEGRGIVLQILRFDSFAKQFAKSSQALLDVIACNAWRQLLFGRRMITLVQSDDPKIAFDPVGAQPVLWNPTEWLDTRRMPRPG